MRDETRKRLALTGEDARFTKQLGASTLISVVRRDDLDELLADAALLAEVRDWVVEVRDAVLLPLATQDNDLGKVAEGFGQSTVALLKRLGGG